MTGADRSTQRTYRFSTFTAGVDMTDKPIPARWAFREVERFRAEYFNVLPNDLNIDVWLRDPIGWGHYWMMAAYIERNELDNAPAMAQGPRPA
jgi:hypothetical protein